jgi:putative ABC transport system permease protein
MEILRIAFSSLVANRLRAVLTTLGIIIGVGAVIGLISLGRGVEDYIASEFESLGSNLLAVFSSPPQSPTRDRIEPLTTVEAAEMASLPSVAAMTPIHRLSGTVIYEGENIDNQQSFGVAPNYPALRSIDVLYGRWISEQDIDDRARVMVLGYGVAEELFGEDVIPEFDPTGETVRYRGASFTLIGVMDETSDLAGENNTAFIPISTSQQRLAPPDRSRTRDGGYYLDAIYLQATSEDATDQAVIEVEQYLMDAHNIQFDGEQDFSIVNQTDLLNSLGSITRNLTIFLALISSTSLLVGGIGIMNIMLVSVTERTREIGIRKAIGAKQADILFQFLIESVVLSLLGGFLGIALGFLIATLGTNLVRQLTLSVQMDSIVLATTVSIVVGVFFGFYPAWQAARKNPIDALRAE